MSNANPVSSFTRPADTNAYTSGDLVANTTTAGSVVPLSWQVTGNGMHGNLLIRRIRIEKSTNTLTSANFRVHLYETSPTVTNGDNGAWLTTYSGYLGAFDITIDRAYSDPAAHGSGVPIVGSEVIIDATVEKIIYGLVEARNSYGPGSGEVFTITLEEYIGL